MNSIPFVDISYANGNYNMAANTDLMVMMKASGFYTGSLQPYIDSELDNNYANAKKYDKIPFMYHYFVPAVSALVQAAWFLRCVSPLTVGDGYAVDVEIDGPNLVQDVLTFVTEHHKNTGCYPWVYIDRYLRQKYDWSSVFALCSEWLAAPDVPFNVNISGVGVYVAQQGPIVNGVDTDEYFGSLESLKSYTYGYHAPAVAVSEPTPVVSTPQPVQTTVSEPKPVVDTPTQATTPVATTSTVPEPVARTTTTTSKNQINTTTTQNKPLSTGSASTLGSFPIQTSQVNVHDTTSGFWTRLWNWFLRLIGVK